jgi:soluble P-type ATPase
MDFGRHHGGSWFTERRLAMLGNGANDVTLRNDAGNAILVVKNQDRADAVAGQQLGD